MFKECVKCRQELPFDMFSPSKRGKYKLHSYCKTCNSKISSERYHANIEKYREMNRLRDAENREASREKCRTFYREKKEKDHAYLLWASARERAKKKGLPFTIERSDIVIPKFCPVLGIELSKDTHRGFCDNAPSIDKIVPHLGYVKGNIIVVSYRANSIKRDASLEEIKKIYNFYKKLM